MPPGGIVPGSQARILFNWELPVGATVNPVARTSGPRLLAQPDSVSVIRRWSPGFATLATNHCLDAGPEGLTETISCLKLNGFEVVGAGRTYEEIAEPLIWETADGRLAVVNWVFPETHPDWRSVPGPNCWPGIEGARLTIGGLKQDSDWVLVVLHWSDELFAYPRPEDRLVARELAQMGADLIIGHHPHVVRGRETIGSCEVFYSLGNFYFSDIPDGSGGWIARAAPRNRENLGIQVSFRRGARPECRALSFWQKRRESAIDPFRRAARRMDRVSNPLVQLSDPDYSDWYARSRARFDRWGYRWQFGIWQLGVSGAIRNLSHRLRRLAGAQVTRRKPVRLEQTKTMGGGGTAA